MCMGLDASIEGEQGDVSNEYASGDKIHLNLPGLQQELLEAVHKTGKPVILVLLSGSALSVAWADENVPAIIEAWYPGAEGGEAIASMIFGEYSPSGRLPVTFYRTTEELPDFKDYSMKNRTYKYMKNEALYPFGYGLSYTKFEYTELKISSDKINAGDSIKCSIKVRNAGEIESDEIVQLYLKDMEASVEVPRWQLAGIRRVNLKPSEEIQAELEISPRQMALIDYEGKCILEPGYFEIFVSGSQPDEKSQKLTGVPAQSARFEVLGFPMEIEY
ncbi:MAG TPA: glycoside hydrolase family 3 C-terminal domain-containing protein, partial [Clostridia bacterium]